MRIPASRFTAIPEGCPVLWGDTPATVIGRHSATEYRLRTSGRMVLATAGAESQLVVALDSPAAIRAFAPELICAVRGGPTDLPRHPPGVVWDESSPPDAPQYVLVVSIGVAESTANRTFIAGPTPAACLLAGLQAALDAAGGAS